MIKSGETVNLVKLTVRERAGKDDGKEGEDKEGEEGVSLEEKVGAGLNVNTHLTLLTNVTSVRVPLVLFNGKLHQVGTQIIHNKTGSSVVETWARYPQRSRVKSRPP